MMSNALDGSSDLAMTQGALTLCQAHATIIWEKHMNHVLQEHSFKNGQKLQLVHGDLTIEQVDAIVNAANAYLKHGGGVAGAIVQRGGGQIQLESDAWVHQWGSVRHEKPAYTGAGKLPCRYVIHAVGPVWGEGEEDSKLTAAVTGSLALADQLGLTSIAFPAISTGIFGFPKERAARLISIAIQEYFEKQAGSGIKLVRLTLYDQATLAAFSTTWQALGFSYKT
jgi:O-acetyl-ADP-ribose deacetylase (regulator of RNase III)